MATKVKNERNVISEQNRDKVIEQLQNCLVDLIDLALQSKQAHWNLVGRRFRSFHLQLDDIVDAARDAADDVAERIATLNCAADGRADTISSQSRLDNFPEGRQDVDDAVTLIADRLETTIGGLRKALEPMGDLDLITEDLLIGISGKLEKHLWMVQMQEED